MAAVPQTPHSAQPTESANPDYRQAYREEFIGKRYSGYLHMAFTCGLSTVVMAWCFMNLNNVSGWEWLVVPISFVYANFAEWAGHKHVMHRPVKGLQLVYRRHSLQHHRFFTHQYMQVDSLRDFKAVLFPPVLVIFFLFAAFLPMALLVNWALGANASLLFTATIMGYFLNYELLHFAYHMPPGHWVHKMPYFNHMRALHTSHHNPHHMAHHNFNITYPIADWVMGTWKR